jgi:hypothetical protein
VNPRDTALSRARQPCPETFQAYPRRHNFIRRNSTLSKARQPDPPPDNVVAEQARLVLELFNVVGRQITLNRAG